MWGLFVSKAAFGSVLSCTSIHLLKPSFGIVDARQWSGCARPMLTTCLGHGGRRGRAGWGSAVDSEASPCHQTRDPPHLGWDALCGCGTRPSKSGPWWSVWAHLRLPLRGTGPPSPKSRTIVATRIDFQPRPVCRSRSEGGTPAPSELRIICPCAAPQLPKGVDTSAQAFQSCVSAGVGVVPT